MLIFEEDTLFSTIAINILKEMEASFIGGMQILASQVAQTICTLKLAKVFTADTIPRILMAFKTKLRNQSIERGYKSSKGPFEINLYSMQKPSTRFHVKDPNYV